MREHLRIVKKGIAYGLLAITPLIIDKIPGDYRFGYQLMYALTNGSMRVSDVFNPENLELVKYFLKIV